MNTPTSGWMSRFFCPEGYHDPINQGGEDGFTRGGWRDTHGEVVLSVFCAKIQVPIHQFVVDIVRAISSTESSNPSPLYCGIPTRSPEQDYQRRLSQRHKAFKNNYITQVTEK